MTDIEVPKPVQPEAKTVADPLDPVEIKTVEVEVPCEVTKVATSLTVGQKMYIEKCFKAISSEIQTGVNGVLDEFRRRVNSAFLESDLKDRAWQAKIDKETNEMLKKVDQKFSGMYRTLIHEFLVRLERRIINAELYTRALVEKTAETVAAHEEHHAALYQTVLSLEARMNALVPLVAVMARDPEALLKEIGEAAKTPKVDPEYTIESWKTQYNERVEQEAEAFAERAEKAQLAPKPGYQSAPVSDSQNNSSPKEEKKENVAVQTDPEITEKGN